VPPGIEPLPFYYDVAQFRGSGNHTNVEVYVGVPTDMVTLEDARGEVTRSVAIATIDGDEVQKSNEPLIFSVADTTQLRKGAFAPDVSVMKIQPGAYRLAVRVADQRSGKWGVYVQELNVQTFGDSLSLSDLEMAYEIANRPRDHRFKKGEVWVIPMPSRNYQREQSPSVYYEVYNLTKDVFGQTRYRVDYTIQQDIRKGVGVFGALSAGMQKLMTSGKPQVVVSYERTGSEVWEPIYLELNTKQVKAGLNQLEVTVTDMVSGQSVSKRAMFQLSGRGD
jgi:hypothetical protein